MPNRRWTGSAADGGAPDKGYISGDGTLTLMPAADRKILESTMIEVGRKTLEPPGQARPEPEAVRQMH